MHRNITRTSNRCLKTNVKEPCQQTFVYAFEMSTVTPKLSSYLGSCWYPKLCGQS